MPEGNKSNNIAGPLRRFEEGISQGPISQPASSKGVKRLSTMTGVVVSNKMNKTIVVRIDSVTRHPIYKKVVRRSRKVKAHDEKNVAKIGDVVKITPTRPLSKDKRWRLMEVVGGRR